MKILNDNGVPDFIKKQIEEYCYETKALTNKILSENNVIIVQFLSLMYAACIEKYKEQSVYKLTVEELNDIITTNKSARLIWDGFINDFIKIDKIL